ncbi:MAG TPA: PAC2 family protein [Beutenbergiaceae bacterium]|nr:PAC2 family protein [Beutenbergiaceae bacterium]
MNPRDLYEVTGTDHPQVPVLVHALEGAIDAGNAGELARDHLLRHLPSQRVVTFDVDRLIDYRARRPLMDFVDGQWTGYDKPEIVIDLLRDDEGKPLLLLHGCEPDVHWERFIEAVRIVVEKFGVQLTLGIHGIPMGVPHTRPITVTAHATRKELIEDTPDFAGTVKVPAMIGNLLQYRLGQDERDAVGFAVNVPHYLTQTDYPQAAAELVRRVARAGELSLPVGDLEARGVKVQAEIERQVEESDEVRALVATLESHYDSFSEQEGTPPPLPAAEVPTADDIAAQVEAFLAGQQDEEG